VGRGPRGLGRRSAPLGAGVAGLARLPCRGVGAGGTSRVGSSFALGGIAIPITPTPVTIPITATPVTVAVAIPVTVTITITIAIPSAVAIALLSAELPPSTALLLGLALGLSPPLRAGEIHPLEHLLQSVELGLVGFLLDLGVLEDVHDLLEFLQHMLELEGDLLHLLDRLGHRAMARLGGRLGGAWGFTTRALRLVLGGADGA